MKIWINDSKNGSYAAQAVDDKALEWMKANTPIQARFYGNALVVPQAEVESFENKFVDAGGQLI